MVLCNHNNILFLHEKLQVNNTSCVNIIADLFMFVFDLQVLTIFQPPEHLGF